MHSLISVMYLCRLFYEYITAYITYVFQKHKQQTRTDQCNG